MSGLPKILFVDDDAQLLGGLTRAFRKRAGQWTMTFALGGSAALEQLASQQFDVVVTDMRMPDVDGVRVLARTRELAPATIRFMLSGFLDPSAAGHTPVAAHQLFSKPFDTRLLALEIDRGCEVRALFRDPDLQRLAPVLEQLAPVPEPYRELVALLGGMQLSAHVATVIGAVPELAARTLELARSLRTPVASIEHAGRLLGPATVAALAIGAHAFAALRAPAVEVRSALVRALAAYDAAPPADASLAFAAGLLAGIGPLIADRIVGTVPATRCGAYVLACWNLPVAVLEAAAAGVAAPRSRDVTERRIALPSRA